MRIASVAVDPDHTTDDAYDILAVRVRIVNIRIEEWNTSHSSLWLSAVPSPSYSWCIAAFQGNSSMSHLRLDTQQIVMNNNATHTYL